MSGSRLDGGGAELMEAFAPLHDRGVDRFYVWFTDFAPPATVEAFGDEVIAAMGG